MFCEKSFHYFCEIITPIYIFVWLCELICELEYVNTKYDDGIVNKSGFVLGICDEVCFDIIFLI